MTTHLPSVRSIFDHAAEIASHADRKAYLDQACAGATEIRAQVEALLDAHENAGSFLNEPPLGGQPTAEFEPIIERPGTIVGPYKLLEQIGEGGFGVVFLAEQL